MRHALASGLFLMIFGAIPVHAENRIGVFNEGALLGPVTGQGNLWGFGLQLEFPVKKIFGIGVVMRKETAHWYDGYFAGLYLGWNPQFTSRWGGLIHAGAEWGLPGVQYARFSSVARGGQVQSQSWTWAVQNSGFLEGTVSPFASIGPRMTLSQHCAVQATLQLRWMKFGHQEAVLDAQTQRLTAVHDDRSWTVVPGYRVGLQFVF